MRDHEIRIGTELLVHKGETDAMVPYPGFDLVRVLRFLLLFHKAVCGHHKGIMQSCKMQQFIIKLLFLFDDGEHIFDPQIVHHVFVFDPLQLKIFEKKPLRKLFLKPEEQSFFQTLKFKFMRISKYSANLLVRLMASRIIKGLDLSSIW